LFADSAERIPTAEKKRCTRSLQFDVSRRDYYGFKVWHKHETLELKSLAASYLQALILALYLLHPGLTLETLLVFKCTHLGKNQDYLSFDMDESCNSPTWWGWATFGSIYFVLYSCGLVIFAGVILFRFYEHDLNQIQNRKSLRASGQMARIDVDAAAAMVSEDDRLGEADISTLAAKAAEQDAVVRLFSYLLIGLQTDRWYWELLVLARKMAIVFVSVFMPPSIQLLCGLLIIVISIELHRMYTPFYDAGTQKGSLLIQRLEMISLQTVNFSLLMAIWYQVQAQNTLAQQINTVNSLETGISVPLLFVNFCTFSLFIMVYFKPSMSTGLLDRAYGKVFVIDAEENTNNTKPFPPSTTPSTLPPKCEIEMQELKE
jgi:hypothetical protein